MFACCSESLYATAPSQVRRNHDLKRRRKNSRGVMHPHGGGRALTVCHLDSAGARARAPRSCLGTAGRAPLPRPAIFRGLWAYDVRASHCHWHPPRATLGRADAASIDNNRRQGHCHRTLQLQGGDGQPSFNCRLDLENLLASVGPCRRKCTPKLASTQLYS